MSGCTDSEPFALQVLGDSMEPEFQHGIVVVAEPGALLESGCYVIALHEDGYLLRQLVRDDGRWYLKALNPRYATHELTSLSAVRGRVIQRAGRRRAERKSYL